MPTCGVWGARAGDVELIKSHSLLARIESIEQRSLYPRVDVYEV